MNNAKTQIVPYTVPADQFRAALESFFDTLGLSGFGSQVMSLRVEEGVAHVKFIVRDKQGRSLVQYDRDSFQANADTLLTDFKIAAALEPEQMDRMEPGDDPREMMECSPVSCPPEETVCCKSLDTPTYAEARRKERMSEIGHHSCCT